MTEADPSPASGRRAVVLVSNPAAPYSRALRVARALESMGYEVEIAASVGPELPELEEVGPNIRLRRYPPQLPSGAIASSPTPAQARARGGASAWSFVRHRLGRTHRYVVRFRDALLWPKPHVRAWWKTLEERLEPADLYHACGVFTIAPALAARARAATAGALGAPGAAGAPSRPVVIHDVIDSFFESNNVVEMPSIPRALNARRERRWARSADAIICVNDRQGARLAKRWGLRRPPVVVANYPEPPVADADRTDLLREALGIPAQTRIVLFQGRLGPQLGIDELAEAILQVDRAVLVVMGFGRWFDQLRARDEDPRWKGRHFTIPARHPDELLAWTASADVAAVPLPTRSTNQRLSSPNKFWEALLAGTPVVVPEGLDVMTDLVRGEALGEVAASSGPADLAMAIGRVLDVSVDVAAERRRRIAALARERYSWPVAAAAYRAVVERATDPRDRRASGAARIAGSAR